MQITLNEFLTRDIHAKIFEMDGVEGVLRELLQPQ